MAKRKKERVDASTTSTPQKPFNNPFAGLAALKDSLPDAPTPVAVPARPDPEPDTSGPGRKIVVAREKKGRAGKTVTRIFQLDLDEAALAALANTLKRTLGCGGSVEEGDIVLAGDQTERAAKLVREKTNRRVVIGN